MVLGPALAGIVIVGGYELGVLSINTVSFFAVLAVIASFTPPPPSFHGDTSIVDAVREGVRFVRRDPALRFVVESLALNSLLAAPFIAPIPRSCARCSTRRSWVPPCS